MEYFTRTGLSGYELLVSEDCNLRCKYCFDDQIHNRSKTSEFNRPAFMSLDLVEHIINFIKKTKAPDRPASVQFFGGEPLMNFKFIQKFVELSKEEFKENIHFGMGSNGTLLNREKVDFIMNNNIRINFSVDGKRSTHDKRRIYPGGSGSWEKALQYYPEILSKTMSRNISPPAVNYTVEADEIESFEENYKFIMSLSKGNGQVLFNFQSEWTDERLKRLEEIWNKIFLYGNTRLPQQYEMRINSPSNSHCHTPDNNITISSDGGLFFCHRLTPKMYEDDKSLKVGDVINGITNKSLDNSFRLRTNFEAFKEISACKECDSHHPCYGGCLASHRFNSENSDNLMFIDNNMCKIYKIIYNKPLQEKVREFFKNSQQKTC